MLGLGHCHQILANKTQESVATFSMKKKKTYLIAFVYNFFCSVR